METEKLPCKECGKLVLPSTLDRTEGKCMPCYKKDHPLMKERKSFLYEYGGYLVYLVFLIGLFLNGAVAYMHYGAGKWFFGTWALLSIVFLPRPALALILLAGHKLFLDSKHAGDSQNDIFSYPATIPRRFIHLLRKETSI